MRFFRRIKRKMAFRTSCLGLLTLLVGCGAGYEVLCTGLSGSAKWAWGLRGFSFRVPLPNWLTILFFSVIAILGFICFVYSIKSLFRNKEYEKVLEKVERLGGEDYVGEMLSSLSKNIHAKGDLRYNQRVLFYMKGIDINLIEPSSIIDLQPCAKNKGSSEEKGLLIVQYTDGSFSVETNTERAAWSIYEDMTRVFSGSA